MEHENLRNSQITTKAEMERMVESIVRQQTLNLEPLEHLFLLEFLFFFSKAI